ITSSVIRDSSANGGGGIGAAFGTLVLTNVTIANNSAGFGGGLNLQNVMAALTNVTISGNTASTSVGGIDFFASGAGATSSLRLINSTVTANSSPFAAGIFNGTQSGAASSTFTVGNSIV